MITKDNFIVITGGPGGGKTTLLDALAAKGFEYIGETARQIIRERKGNGLPSRPAPNEFARLLFKLDSENYLNNLDVAEILFFDRSFFDSAFLLQQVDKHFFETKRNFIETNRFYNNVFITPPWPEIYCNDNERDQTFEQAVNVYETLYRFYQLNGYELIVLPKSSIDERVEFVLDNLAKESNAKK